MISVPHMSFFKVFPFVTMLHAAARATPPDGRSAGIALDCIGSIFQFVQPPSQGPQGKHSLFDRLCLRFVFFWFVCRLLLIEVYIYILVVFLFFFFCSV
jgi:hypothetical protein